LLAADICAHSRARGPPAGDLPRFEASNRRTSHGHRRRPSRSVRKPAFDNPPGCSLDAQAKIVVCEIDALSEHKRGRASQPTMSESRLVSLARSAAAGALRSSSHSRTKGRSAKRWAIFACEILARSSREESRPSSRAMSRCIISFTVSFTVSWLTRASMVSLISLLHRQRGWLAKWSCGDYSLDRG
jgi:hypothetical protein